MARHKFQSTFKDGNGRVVGSSTTADGTAGTVSVYLAGTETKADIYTASSGGTAVNSVTTNTHGYFYFWIDDSDYLVTQNFKIILSHADFESKTYDDINIIGASAIPTATTSLAGISELATKAETLAGTDTTRAVTADALAYALQAGTMQYVADTASNDTYIATLVPAIDAYADGMMVSFKAKTANTGASTLNVNGKGAKAIKKHHDQDTATGDIEAGQIVTVIYDLTNTVWQMQSQQGIAPAPVASPTFTDQATIPTINLTGGQIAFPATAVPSADPNTLDDYEEGDHEVAATMSTSGTVTLGGDSNATAYTKTGRQITTTGVLIVTSVSSPVGELRFSIPFTIGNLTAYAEMFGSGIYTYSVDYSTGSYVIARGGGGESFVKIKTCGDNIAYGNVVPAAEDQYGFSFSYFI